jgi:hypothetical protein
MIASAPWRESFGGRKNRPPEIHSTQMGFTLPAE